MDKRNWQIVYNDYSGMQKRAVELISKEMGAQILRDKGIYTIYVLPCVEEKKAELNKNSVVIGLFDESEIIKKHIKADEIKQDGYVVKVMNNPENEEFKLVLITAKSPEALFYGAVDYVDDFFVNAATEHGIVKLIDEVFCFSLPDYYVSSAPAIKKRGVFTWGHPINDYRNYIENMARLKLNELIIWNDFVPLNAKEIVEYAHSFGIKVIWGFAWGWSRNCANIDFNSFEKLSEDILKTYEEQYRDTGADGIYFQSFTELHTSKIGNKNIAEAVTDFVNLVAGRILEKYPDLYIQFGLHAISVKNHLEFISKVDKRVEIMWEDCGAFPYSYNPVVKDRKDFDEALDFTDKMLSLRENAAVSMLFKGFMTLDWTGNRFCHQAGPFVLGESSKRIIENDKEVIKPMWRQLQAGWLQNGNYAFEMAKHIFENGNDSVTVGMAGQFADGIWFPQALCAQILWDCDKSYEEVFNKVSKRRCVDIV